MDEHKHMRYIEKERRLLQNLEQDDMGGQKDWWRRKNLQFVGREEKSAKHWENRRNILEDA